MGLSGGLPEMPPSKEKESAFQLARVLAILGGLFAIVAGALELTSLAARRNIPSLESVASTAGYGVLDIVLGIVALIGSRFVKRIVWSVVLIIVGVIAYPFGGGFPWGYGPIIVIIAGVVGIIAKLV